MDVVLERHRVEPQEAACLAATHVPHATRRVKAVLQLSVHRRSDASAQRARWLWPQPQLWQRGSVRQGNARRPYALDTRRGRPSRVAALLTHGREATARYPIRTTNARTIEL